MNISLIKNPCPDFIILKLASPPLHIFWQLYAILHKNIDFFLVMEVPIYKKRAF